MLAFLTGRAARRARAATAHTTLIGVTGTAGASLVAGALAHVLGQQKNIRHISVKQPGQLLRQVAATSATDAMIVEYPLTAPGDIDSAARQLPPHIAIIAGLHAVRLDLFQEKRLILHEAASLLAVQERGKGAAVLSADDPAAVALARHAKAPIIWHGAAATAGLQLIRLTRRSAGGFAAEVAVSGARYELHLPHLRAGHHVSYLLAALAAAHAAGAEIRQAIRDSQSYQPPAGMMQRHAGIRESVLLDDTAQFTPEGALQALTALAEITARRRLAIIGSIPQLGLHTAPLHQDIGQAAARAANIIVTIGEEARLANEAAARANQRCDPHHFVSAKEAVAYLAPHLKSGDLVLVKTSFKQGREIVEGLAK